MQSSPTGKQNGRDESGKTGGKNSVNWTLLPIKCRVVYQSVIIIMDLRCQMLLYPQETRVPPLTGLPWCKRLSQITEDTLQKWLEEMDTVHHVELEVTVILTPLIIPTADVLPEPMMT
jgi:hypothetical protein